MGMAKEKMLQGKIDGKVSLNFFFFLAENENGEEVVSTSGVCIFFSGDRELLKNTEWGVA